MRGNILGSLVTQIYDEVFELVKVFAECKYDPLDPGDPVSHGRNRMTLGGVGGLSQEVRTLISCHLCPKVQKLRSPCQWTDAWAGPGVREGRRQCW